jgi:tetratricopeptide (TPR) repeat protein
MAAALVAKADKLLENTGFTKWFTKIDYEEIADLLVNAGNMYIIEKNKDAASICYKRACSYYLMCESGMEIECYKRLINLNQDNAEIYIPKLIDHYAKKGDWSYAGDQSAKFGDVYWNQKLYASALEYHMKAIEYYSMTPHSNGISKSTERMAQIYVMLGQYLEAAKTYETLFLMNKVSVMRYKIIEYAQLCIMCYLAEGDTVKASNLRDKYSPDGVEINSYISAVNELDSSNIENYCTNDFIKKELHSRIIMNCNSLI